MGLKALTAEIYARVQQHLLPPGIPWKRDSDGTITKVLLATGDELARVSQRGVDLIAEADPRTTDELLTDFETALDLSADPIPVIWIDGVNVTATGNTLEKTAGGSAWNAGAISSVVIEGDGHVDFGVDPGGSNLMCGLSVGDTDQSFVDIDFAIWIQGAGDIRVMENGAQRIILAVGFAADDFARVRRIGTEITYWHFDASENTLTKFYTSGEISTGDLLVDCSINVQTNKIVDAVIQSTELRRDRVISRMIQHQRARPVDFQEALASILGQESGDVVVIETTRAQAIAQNDDQEIYRFFVYRDPTDPGTYDIVAAQEEIDRIAQSHTKGHAIESIGMIVNDPFSLVNRDIIGA